VRTFPHIRRAAFRSLSVCLAIPLCAAIVFFLDFSSAAQDAPLDASETSRDLLYLAPSRAGQRVTGDVVWTAYVGTRFDYARRNETEWMIHPGAAEKGKPAERKGVTTFGEYELVGASDDDRATLALRNKASQEVLATVTVWERDQLVEAWLPELRKQKRGLTADGLRQDLEVADPQVRAIDRLAIVSKSAGEGSILVAVGQSTGESELGLATIVKFDVDTRTSKVYHPPGMLTCEVSTLGVTASVQKPIATVWFGTSTIREGAIAPCGGLFKLDPETRGVTAAPGATNPPIGSVVTLLSSGWQGALDVATDAGICGLAGRSEEHWTCWRFVPTATLKDAMPVANRPGDKPYGQLKPGDYEVLWANQNYLEVATPDSFDAWLAADDYAEAVAHNFDVEPYKLLNTASGGPAPIRPLAKPNGEPLNGALVLRAPLEKLVAPAGTPNGWVRIRARTGWIARAKLEVTPKLISVQKQ
jgi:hypothetical protein